MEETNSAGTVVARHSDGLNIDEPLAMLRSGATSYYHADGLGSITSLSNPAGALAQTYTFDTFGKQTASSGSLTNPFRYTARESDTETNLYYYRARYYDPSIGRFMSEDSSQQGVQGDEVDLYRYALNSPTNFVDPLGRFPATFTVPSYLPLPSLPIEALLECITYKTGTPLLVTSTSEITWRHPAKSPHGRGVGVDLNYPANPADADKILCAASFCGAGFGLDEKKHPSPNSTGDHIHLQIPPGTRGGHGDLPKPTCLGCGGK